jgi:hypothetical protein
VVSTYLSILRTPGSARVTLAGLLGRLAYLAGPYCLLLYGTQHGSIRYGADLAAAFSAGSAVGMPLSSWLAGRVPPARLVLSLAPLSVAAGILTLLARDHRTAAAAGVAVTALLLPPFGPLVRSRWSRVLILSQDLAAARSLEAALTEGLIVLGPAIMAGVAAGFGATAGLVLLLALVAAGTLGLAAGLEPIAPARIVSAASIRPVRSAWMPAVLLLLASVVVCAAGLAAVEVATPAALLDRGGVAAESGPVLAVLALGSALGGLWYGTRRWIGAAGSRYAVACVLSGLGCWLLVLACGHTVLGLAVVVAAPAGLPLAATAIEEFALLETRTPAAHLTTGFAVLLSANSAGAALGAVAAGRLLDRHLTSAAVAALAAGALVLAGLGGWVAAGLSRRS